MTAAVVYSLGHSNRTLEDFLELLGTRGVQQLADVRRYPASRRYPWFHGDSLAGVLSGAGIEYRHFVDLGGYRKARPDSVHVGWPEPGFRAYADAMATEPFRRALADLESWAEGTPCAVLCAEREPGHCHRRLLCDALLRDGFRVVHVVELDPRTDREHELPAFARIVSGEIRYDRATLPLRFGRPPTRGR